MCWSGEAIRARYFRWLLARMMPVEFLSLPSPSRVARGLFLMPAQFAVNQWGCYIMDVDRKTICAYQFFPNDHQLRLMAARNFTYDLMLKNLNTGTNPGEMMPEEVHKLVDKEQQDERVRGAKEVAPPAETPQKQE